MALEASRWMRGNVRLLGPCHARSRSQRGSKTARAEVERAVSAAPLAGLSAGNACSALVKRRPAPLPARRQRPQRPPNAQMWRSERLGGGRSGSGTEERNAGRSMPSGFQSGRGPLVHGSSRRPSFEPEAPGLKLRRVQKLGEEPCAGAPEAAGCRARAKARPGGKGRVWPEGFKEPPWQEAPWPISPGGEPGEGPCFFEVPEGVVQSQLDRSVLGVEEQEGVLFG